MNIKYDNNGSIESIDIPCSDEVKLLIVEGFESVGKTHFINNVVVSNKNIKAWSPRKIYDLSTDSTEVVPYDHRYVLNLAIIDLAKEGLLSDEVVMVDRGLISGVVYSLAKNQENQLLTPGFLEVVKKLYTSKSVYNIYLSHPSIEVADKLYHLTQEDSSVKESYDKFSDFDEYVQEYKKFNKLYMYYLDKLCGSNYSVLSSISYEILK